MPLLPLETFREIMGFNPYHFWGMANSDVPQASACDDIVKKYSWQNADAAGRDNILNAIETAEGLLTDYLGYSPAPHYVQETLAWPTYNQNALHRHYPEDSKDRWVSVTLSEGEVRAAGIEALTFVEEVSVVYSDQDGDGLDETFTLTTAAALGTTDPDEIAVYFIPTDRMDNDGVSDKWRVKPVKVSIVAGIATITGKAWMLAKPVLYEGFDVNPIDPSIVANFVTKLDVYRRYTDASGTTSDTAQAAWIYETLPFPYCCEYAPSVPSSQDPAAIGKVAARVGIRSAEMGIVTPIEAVYDATTGTWISGCDWPHRLPDRVTVRTLSGLALENGQMQRKWQVVVARLAAAEMARPICACDIANRELYHWQFDLSRAAGKMDEQYRIADDDLNNPFGQRRGHVFAWKQVQNLMLIRGIRE